MAYGKHIKTFSELANHIEMEEECIKAYGPFDVTLVAHGGNSKVKKKNEDKLVKKGRHSSNTSRPKVVWLNNIRLKAMERRNWHELSAITMVIRVTSFVIIPSRRRHGSKRIHHSLWGCLVIHIDGGDMSLQFDTIHAPGVQCCLFSDVISSLRIGFLLDIQFDSFWASYIVFCHGFCNSF